MGYSRHTDQPVREHYPRFFRKYEANQEITSIDVFIFIEHI